MVMKRIYTLLMIIGLVVTACGPAIKPTIPYQPEVKLNVPFEPNLGSTCFSSSFSMVMRYWGKDIHVYDVLEVVGRPPFKGYEHPKLNRWMKRKHDLRFKYLFNSSIENVKLYLNEGYPVIVHQTMSLSDNTGHNRVVIGYSDPREIFIINDPSLKGPNYEISYTDFKKLWRNITVYENGPSNKVYLVMPTSR